MITRSNALKHDLQNIVGTALAVSLWMFGLKGLC